MVIDFGIKKGFEGFYKVYLHLNQKKASIGKVFHKRDKNLK